jgi:predicted ATPase
LNSSGKSNLIDAIKFVRDALHNGLDQAITERHGLQSIRQWSPTRPYHVTISLEVSTPRAPPTRTFEGSGSFLFTLKSQADEYIIDREEASWRERIAVRRRGDENPRFVTRHYSYTRTEDGENHTN